MRTCHMLRTMDKCALNCLSEPGSHRHFCGTGHKYRQSLGAATMAANTVRLGRLAPGGRWVMVPLDHGISMGPLPGLADVRVPLRAAADGGASCVTLHKGLVGLASQFTG